MDKTKIDFDAPAFASSKPSAEIAPTVDSPTEGEGSGEGTPASGGAPVVVPKAPVEEPSEQQVPYSRFSTALSRAKEAEREAEEARIRYEELQDQLKQRNDRPQVNHETPESFRGNLPNYWLKLYGDSPASREAYGYELERQREIEERAEQRALQAIETRSTEERQVLSRNEQLIDNRLDNLKADLNRDLTEQEESALLDIVDEYTPKDEDGNYAGDIISFDKAWEIYELRATQQSNASKRSRSAATAVTGSRSEGEPGADPKATENWDPRDWNSYRKRIT